MGKYCVFAAATIVLFATGCTAFVRTNAASHVTATTLSPDRHLAFKERKDGYVPLVVTRDEGFMGKGCYLGLLISGELAGRFGAKETAQYFVPPGELRLAVVPDPKGRGLCSIGGWDPVPEKYDMKSDAPNHYRISLGAYRRPRLIPSVY